MDRFPKRALNFKDHKFDAATTGKEIKELVGTGFENADKMRSILILGRPKRFAGFSQEYYYVTVRLSCYSLNIGSAIRRSERKRRPWVRNLQRVSSPQEN